MVLEGLMLSRGGYVKVNKQLNISIMYIFTLPKDDKHVGTAQYKYVIDPVCAPVHTL